MARLKLPSDRFVLSFGVVIAAVTYVYWTVLEWDRAAAMTSLPALRAGIALGATLLLTLVLRAVRTVDERADADD